MTLYSNEVRDYVHSRDWPVGLILDIEEKFVEIDHREGSVPIGQAYLQIIFYRDNFGVFEPGKQLLIAQTMNEVMMKLRNDGIPCYLEVRAHANERQQ